jgi:hypothetical protein
MPRLGRRGGGRHDRAVQSGRMIRRLWTAASVLSLLLCAAVIALWVRSYRGCDLFYFSTSGSNGYVVANTGDLGAVVTRYGERFLDLKPFWGVRRRPRFGDGTGVFHFQWTTMIAPQMFCAVGGSPPNPSPPDHRILCSAPCWAAVLLTAFLPAAVAAKRWHARVRPGLCACGYDLRASTSRCPECGSPMPAKS